VNIAFDALQAPTAETLDAWLNTPRLARCGKLFTPSEPMWMPDRAFARAVNWQAAIACVAPEWQQWLQATLAYSMADSAQGTVVQIASVLSRAAQDGLDPLNDGHLIDLRERFNLGEFSSLASFMDFWHDCESVEKRPSHFLIDAYKALPRKKRVRRDVILSLDPEEGPFTQVEQDAIHQWTHEQFCHGNLDPEQYLYLHLLIIFGQRGVQLRMIIFGDFIKSDRGYKIRLFWAKGKDEGSVWRVKSEIFSLDEDLYNMVQAYKEIVLARLLQEYPARADWNEAIKNVPLFRRKVEKGVDAFRPPVLIDHPNLKALEDAPQREFHVGSGSVKVWLKRIEKMAGFPVSHRTHQPMVITRGHRFRHTLGTDLSNAGYGERAIAHALMQSDVRSVRKYRQISAELMSLIDAKMSDHLATVVNAFTGTVVVDRAVAKNGDRVDRQIEDIAVCGSDAACHLDAPFTCYACGKFQPLLDANHTAVLERLERRREQTIATDRTTGVLWDRAILACRKVILDCEALRQSAQSDGIDA